MKLLAVVTFCVFWNARTRAVVGEPMPFSRTNHRESSPGACNIASGCENVRFGNTRCSWIDVPTGAAFAGATHVRFDGRASRPTVAPGGGGGGGCWTPSSSDEWHASSTNSDAIKTANGPERCAGTLRPCFEKLRQCCLDRDAQNKGTFVGFRRRNLCTSDLVSR